MNSIVFYTVLLICFCNIGYGQYVEGKIIDSETNEPLSYAHIGLLNQPIGTISDEDGNFKINISRASPNDTISFSFIGYQQENLKITNISKKYLKVKLKKATYNLDEIVIENNQLFVNEKIIGRTKGRNTYTGSTEVGWGGEIGIKIRADGKNLKVKDINFKVMGITYDSLLFSINMYTTKNGFPHKSILKKPIYILGVKDQNWVKKNLISENIYFSDEIITTVESIKGWPSNESGYGVFYCNGKSYKSKTYYKEASMSKWKIRKEPKLTLFLTTQELVTKENKKKETSK